MNKKLGIGIVVIAAIVAVAMFSGCVEKEKAPLPTPTPSSTPVVTPSPTAVPSPSPSQSPSPLLIISSPTPSPETSPTSTPKPIERPEDVVITDAKPVDYEGSPALNVSIFGKKFHTNLSVTVKNKYGHILDAVIIPPEKEKGIIRTSLKIGDYHETLKAHVSPRVYYEFTVTVSDNQGILADNTFKFEGAKATIIDNYVNTEWIVVVEGEKLVKKLFIKGVDYTLANEGDLPVYPDHATFASKSINCPEFLLERERKGCHTDLSVFGFYSIIIVYDKNNKKIAETIAET